MTEGKRLNGSQKEEAETTEIKREIKNQTGNTPTKQSAPSLSQPNGRKESF